ncbi:uncharacterized protein B0H18DRAFT_120785 [Fomitopsis serialis]|uniref:uncharacterized protein n=1 Tax=Fomitopsis serialis TaxID=139415 RepID=UPI0020089567|nr:uncharacterized protein B0H18DRAFT_120785 [Neoantrodia serialis]KAH9930988.1 hypothetical protein B0H18DRAFT_120785 [Neoantrodia serialis]
MSLPAESCVSRRSCMTPTRATSMPQDHCMRAFFEPARRDERTPTLQLWCDIPGELTGKLPPSSSPSNSTSSCPLFDDLLEEDIVDGFLDRSCSVLGEVVVSSSRDSNVHSSSPAFACETKSRRCDEHVYSRRTNADLPLSLTGADVSSPSSYSSKSSSIFSTVGFPLPASYWSAGKVVKSLRKAGVSSTSMPSDDAGFASSKSVAVSSLKA